MDPPSARDFTGRAAGVTGGACGTGRSTALLLRGRGAGVAVGDRPGTTSDPPSESPIPLVSRNDRPGIAGVYAVYTVHAGDAFARAR